MDIVVSSFRGKTFGRGIVLAITAVGMAASVAVPVLAQDRDPAYASARAAGQVGEKVDGYLGVVGGGAPTLRKLVEDINIRRKSVYATRAQAQHATIEEYAFTTGCQLIGQTRAGEKYQAPDGSWQTRGNGAPLRDPRCP